MQALMSLYYLWDFMLFHALIWQESHLLHANFHLGPEDGSSTRMPGPHSMHWDTPMLSRPYWHVGWEHKLQPPPLDMSLRGNKRSNWGFLQPDMKWIIAIMSLVLQRKWSTYHGKHYIIQSNWRKMLYREADLATWILAHSWYPHLKCCFIILLLFWIWNEEKGTLAGILQLHKTASQGNLTIICKSCCLLQAVLCSPFFPVSLALELTPLLKSMNGCL